MRKYYTRACNFYHGRAARSLIKKNKAFPLNGKKDIAFDKLEIFSREKGKVKTRLINIKDINTLNKNLKKIIKHDLKKIVSRRKNFLKNVNFNIDNNGHLKSHGIVFLMEVNLIITIKL